MEQTEARRNIEALKAIVQTLMPAVYPQYGEKSARAFFEELLDDDEAAAMAIANELTENEIEQAFGWGKETLGGADDEIRATPVVSYLTAEQVERMRVMLVAIDAADNALDAATQMPDPPGREPLGTQERVQIGEQAFVTAMVSDVLAQRGDMLDQDTERTVEETIRALPEPWKKQGLTGLESVRGGVMTTLNAPSWNELVD